jgi:hypothetical protein
VENFDESYQAFRTLSEPELCAGSSRSELNYWRSVFNMLMTGEISLAVAMLQMHSEVAAALDVRMRRASYSVGGGAAAAGAGAIDPAHCGELFAAMEAHPYVLDHSNEGAGAGAMMGGGGASSGLSLGEWQAQLRAIRGGGHNSLLARVPELDTVLRILLGEADALQVSAYCGTYYY